MRAPAHSARAPTRRKPPRRIPPLELGARATGSYRVGGVSPKFLMRVKRSASKAAFRQNIIAIYDRLRARGASRKTAARYAITAARSIRRCSGGSEAPVRLISLRGSSLSPAVGQPLTVTCCIKHLANRAALPCWAQRCSAVTHESNPWQSRPCRLQNFPRPPVWVLAQAWPPVGRQRARHRPRSVMLRTHGTTISNP